MSMVKSDLLDVYFWILAYIGFRFTGTESVLLSGLPKETSLGLPAYSEARWLHDLYIVTKSSRSTSFKLL